MTRYKTLLICILLLAATCCAGKNLALLHYTTDDGLPSNTVYEIYRDSKGFLWFCTNKGVARYNGIRFERFTTADGLADNEIFTAREDAYGRLWLATYNGKLCFYKDGVFHTETNTPYLHIPDHPPFISNIQLQADSSVIIVFWSNSCFVTIDKERVKYFVPQPPKSCNEASSKCIYKINDNQYEIYTDGRQMITIDSNFKVLKKVPAKGFDFFPVNQYLSYIGNKDSIFRLLPGNRSRLVPFIRNRRHISDIYSVYKNEGDSTYFLVTPTASWINDSIRLLPGNRITSVISDLSGNYWISSWDNGVYRLNKNISSIKETKDMYKDKVIYALARDGHIFFTTRNSDVFKWSSDSAFCLYHHTAGISAGYYKTPPCIIDDQYNYYSNPDTGLLLTINNLLSPQPKSKILTLPCLMFYKGGIFHNNEVIFWFSKYIQKLNVEQVRRNIVQPVIINTDAAGRILSMIKDSKGAVWYASLNDLYVIQNDRPVLQPQFHNLGIKNFLILGDKLIGNTQNNRLLVCSHFETGKMRIDTLKDPNCIWENFYMVDSTHVLISTNNQYRVLTLSSPEPTLKVIETPFIPTQAEYICNDKEIWYFFKNGSVFQISKSEFFRQPQPPGMLITEITNQDHRYPMPANGSKIDIPFGKASKTSIHFTALSFNGNSSVSYLYSLSDNDNEYWQSVTTEEINLIALPYGDYTLKIKARTLSSNYGPPVLLRLHVIQPFWTRTWFLALIALLLLLTVAAIFYYIYRLRLYLVKRKHTRELRFLKSEYKAMNALMNPHFIFNSLNNIQGLINRDDKLAANKYLTYFSTMVRQNMHNISEDLIPLQKELDLLRNYLRLEQLRFDHNFDYSIALADNVDAMQVMIAPLLVQPLVENAILHGLLPRKSVKGNIVQIQVYRDKEQYVCIEIKDNGIGLHNQRAGKNHQSFGLQNIRRRIAQLGIMHNQDIGFSLTECKDEAGNIAGVIALIRMMQ